MKVADAQKNWKLKNSQVVVDYRKNYRKENYNIIRKWNLENKDKTRMYSQKWRANKLSSADDVPSDFVKLLFDLQRNKCYYCLQFLIDYHLEHKTPLSRGGKHESVNLVLSCPECNFQKGNKTEEEFVEYRKLLQGV